MCFLTPLDDLIAGNVSKENGEYENQKMTRSPLNVTLYRDFMQKNEFLMRQKTAEEETALNRKKGWRQARRGAKHV